MLPFEYRRHAAILAFVLGILFVVVASGILASHAKLFSIKRDSAVMIGTQLPELKSAVALLQASTEAEEIFAARARAAREEQASAYILPKGSPTSRTISLLQELVLGLRTDTHFALKRVTFQPVTEDLGSVKLFHGKAEFSARFQDIARLLTILGYSGDMMVRDVISVQDQQLFLRDIEKAAPLSLRASEDFLYLDLIDYASAPDMAEQRISSDVSVDVAVALRAFLLQAGLASVRSTLTPVAVKLQDSSLWPLPLLRIDGFSRRGDAWTVVFTVFSR